MLCFGIALSAHKQLSIVRLVLKQKSKGNKGGAIRFFITKGQLLPSLLSFKQRHGLGLRFFFDFFNSEVMHRA
jgi:hypothetical protein